MPHALAPIRESASHLGIPDTSLESYGQYTTKLRLDLLAPRTGRPSRQAGSRPTSFRRRSTRRALVHAATLREHRARDEQGDLPADGAQPRGVRRETKRVSALIS